MDARRCISYLTIEKRGMLSSEEESWLGEWIFGCDICQEVCPFNYTPIKLGKKASLAEFEATQGAGPFLDLRQILSIRDDSAFESRFKGTPLIRPGREGLLRNAAAVAGNTLWIEGVDSLVSVVLEEHPAAVRKSSINALNKISKAAGSKVRRNVQSKLENIRGEAEEQIRLALINFFES